MFQKILSLSIIITVFLAGICLILLQRIDVSLLAVFLAGPGFLGAMQL
jgi:hypothetical protein